MAHNVLYRRRAERDLEKLAEVVTQEWFDGLCDAIESLGEFPERCALAPERALRRKGIRQLLFGEGHSIYRILYHVKEDSVEILTIRHGRRRPIEG